MPSINGVDFNNISSMNGVSWNSVANIGGVTVIHGSICAIVRLGFADGRKNPPSSACTAFPGGFLYDFDETNELLKFLGKSHIAEEAMVLADIYNIDVDVYKTNNIKNKIGFKN